MLLWQNGSGWANFGEPLDEWIDEAAAALARRHYRRSR